MSLFLEQRRRQYKVGKILQTSAPLGWQGMLADHVRQVAGVAPPTEIQLTEVIVVTKAADGLVTRKAHGTSTSGRLALGATWLCPAGSFEEEIVFDAPADLLHLFLPASGFDRLSEIYGGAPVRPTAIGLHGGFRDDLIRQIGAQVISELTNPTAAGRVLVDALSLSLTARLVQAYAFPQGRSPELTEIRHGLGGKRLRCVLDYMYNHIEDQIGIEELALVVGLSPFHFARMFRASTGVPPHRYLSSLRLERAKSLLALSDAPIVEIALATSFSTQANFSRAFRAATGVTPGEFRRRAR